MKLSDILHIKNNNAVKTDEKGEMTESVRNGNTAKINRQIRAMVPGQTLKGEVVGRNGNEVQIRLSEDMVFSARIEREMVLELGRTMTFEVKNNGTALTLSPLFENMAVDANVFKALEMAGITINSKTMEMAENMMAQGMSVDRNSLQGVFRDITVNPGASLSSIIQLHQLNMQVSPENLQQLESYKALQHQLVAGMTSILDEIPMEFQSLLQSGDLENAIRMYMDIARSLTGEEALTAEMPLTGESNIASENGLVSENGIMQENGESIAQNGQNQDAALQGNPVLQENMAAGGETAAAASAPKNLLQYILSPQETEQLAGMLKELNEAGELPEIRELINHIQDGTATTQDVLKALSGQGIYSGVDIRQNVGLARLFSGKEYTKVLKSEILQQWTIEPENVQDASKVEELYQRLSRQLAGIKEALSSAAGGSESSAAKSVANLQNNLDFMNQLNQTYQYIQLPLKMNGKEAHGELYVYTNKRHLAQKDGNVSALLHLEMEYLGPVDVHVAMQEQKVSTKFYLRDDEMIGFIGEHIHILNKRLEQRGYSMKCEMLCRSQEDEGKSMIDRITESGKNVTVLSQYAFDVRA